MDPTLHSQYYSGVSTIFLVRHGQASLHAADYDQLSERGVEQSRELGRAIGARGVAFDAVYVGPLRRHRQTLEGAASSSAAGGVSLPDAVVLEQLSEIDASSLGNEAMARVQPSCPDLREQLASGSLDGSGATAMRHYIGMYEVLMKRWAGGEFEDRVISYSLFSSAVTKGLSRIMREQGRGKRVLVVTSGGPISQAARLALGVTVDKSIELMFALQNASVTELRYTENRLSLVRFNDVGHLPAGMITGI